MNSAFVYGFCLPSFHDLSERIIAEMGRFDKIFMITTKDHMYLNSPKVCCYDIYSLKNNGFDISVWCQDFSEIPPLDEAVIKDYADCEQICLKMFDRTEYEGFYYSYEQRKELYLNHLRFWHHLVNKYNINFMLEVEPPHQMFNWIIYCIMKKREARFFFFSSTFYCNRYIIDSDFYNFPILTAKYEQFLKRCTPDIISKEVLNFYQQKSKKPEDVIPVFYMPNQQEKKIADKLVSKLKNYKHFFLNPAHRISMISSKIAHEKHKKYINKYNKQALEPKKERYVYFALQFQPENTTSPLAGAYVDQYLIVDLLTYYLPSDVVLYVKEHPNQNVIGRSNNYYEKIKAHKNVRLIRTDVNTNTLIDGAVCVCSCTGTVCIESIIRGKPVIMFGNFIYQLAPGVFPVKTAKQLKMAVDEIFLKNFMIDSLQVQLFMQFLYQESTEGFIHPSYESACKISHNQNNNNILQAIKGILA